MRKRDSKGRFMRTRYFPWTPATWDDGFIANGRMRVYRPDFPGLLFATGYAERAHVVYWLEHGIVPNRKFVIHHKDGDMLNDKIENLELMEGNAHRTLHLTKPRIMRICEQCGKEYGILEGRLRGRIKEGKKVRFCSKQCLWDSLRAPMITKYCAFCEKPFEVKDRNKYRDRKYCSVECQGKSRRKK